MRVSSKEDLVEFLDKLKNNLEGLLDINLYEIKDNLVDIINEIKDTLYWV